MDNKGLFQNTQTRYSQIESELCLDFSQKAVTDYILLIRNIAINIARELNSPSRKDLITGIDKYAGITSTLKDPKQQSQYLKHRISLINNIVKGIDSLFNERVFAERYDITTTFSTKATLIDCYLLYKTSRSRSLNYLDFVENYVANNPNTVVADTERVVSLFIREFLRPVSLITDYYTRAYVGDLCSEIIGNWGITILRLPIYEESLRRKPGFVQSELPYVEFL